MCEEVGLERKYHQAYHKSHINKVMALAVVAYAFDGEIENGGDALKLGLFRVQAAKIAMRMQRQGTWDVNNVLRYNGEVIRKKGDSYMVDCNVTGSDEGTSKNPKFSLLSVFRDVVLPKVKAITMAGGEYEGYIPIIQGDNAGPHQDGEYIEYMTTYCKEMGWHWEPQAPQMPYVNNLDLCVFPMMSKRHSQLLQEYSGSVAPNDEIWKAAELVWMKLASCEIAKGFVLATRIARLVVDADGSNDFLRGGKFHVGVRQDFKPSKKGIIRRNNWELIPVVH